ncbi:LON peptidase substrate-binding domain-containing protein [Rhodococcus coprophilus]|uniref:Endopeptidase La n=1 Tax=Rhodococcus coprophilus TaxID=38310 RepID=A0A2X4U7W5_9NOCA|nr:LON peptidase substrate-binding domain-containing protein [Rhodococcus coprophilus]MBM7459098.1 Lon protease-like protein [Rhodococcus coprophilus]SQI34719.1 endopeptidase La [Rhodococcus coprophilus]
MPILPMFPLGTALLPGAGLPLHVFEPRYQQLVHDCMAAPDGPRFGVVLIARGREVGGGEQRNDVGTVARILLDTEIGNGRHVLECVAEERIRVVSWLPDDPYPRAEVEAWPDTGSGPVDLSPLLGSLERLYDLLDRLTEGNAPPPPSPSELPDDPGERLFAIARHVPMGEADRYAVLSTPGPAERLEVLTESVATAIDLASWKLQN